MSTEYEAVTIVGLPVSELGKLSPAARQAIYAGDIDRVAPYFDAPDDDCLVGVIMNRSGDFTWDICDTGSMLSHSLYYEAVQKFKKLFDLNPKFYISVNAS